MKTYIYTMIIAMMGLGVASAQTNIKEIRNEVMDVELLKNWKTGETKTIQDQQITKVKDNGNGTTRTNLMFSPPSKMVFTHPTLMVMPVGIEKAGVVYIMVDRESEDAVNAENFTIQVYDKTGKVELYSVTPENAPGKEFKYGIWYNHFGIEVPATAGNRFQVKVTDNLTGNVVVYNVISNEPAGTIEIDQSLAGK